VLGNRTAKKGEKREKEKVMLKQKSKRSKRG
jgi:hypothetical protein